MRTNVERKPTSSKPPSIWLSNGNRQTDKDCQSPNGSYDNAKNAHKGCKPTSMLHRLPGTELEADLQRQNNLVELFDELLAEIHDVDVETFSLQELRSLFVRLAQFPYLRWVLTPLLQQVLTRGLEHDLSHFILQVEALGLSDDNELAEWVPDEILANPGTITYPPAILSWLRIWSNFPDVALPNLWGHDLTTPDGIMAASYAMLETAAMDVSAELVLFECTFIDYGTIDCFCWRDVVGWFGVDNEFRVVELGDIRREGDRIVVPVGGEELEVDWAVGQWFFQV